MALTNAFLLEPHAFEIFVAVRKDGVRGTGTLNDPLGINPDSSTAAADFDALMNLLPANMRIHLGPGVFKTQGHVVGSTSGWAKKGMKVSGAGMDATTIQVVNTGIINSTMFAIGHPLNIGAQPNLLDFFELSDVTIDCNLTSGTGSNVSCGGVRLMGNHLRLQRVKVINWGANYTNKPCLVLAVVAADPSVSVPATIDPSIVDCIVVQPSTLNVGNVTAIHIGRKDDAATNAEGFAQGPVIRHCFVDCGWPSINAESRGLSMEWCRGGIVEGNQVHFTKYGYYVEKASIREMVIRDNFFKNVAKGLYLKLGQLNPPSPQALTSLERDDSDPSIAVATMSVAHGLSQGDRVAIGASAGSPNEFKGLFLVKDVTVAPPEYKFRYQMTGTPIADAESSPPPVMRKVFGVNNLLVEGNTVELATGSIGLIAIHLDDNSVVPPPDYVNGDIIVRGNHIHYVDSQFASGWSGYGIQVNGAENVIVRDNVVESAPANPVRNQHCGAVTYFNNRAPTGKLIEGYNLDTDEHYGELETDNDFALVMSLFNRRAR